MSLRSSESYMQLLVTGSYSDFTVTCKENTFNVHKCVLCQDSEFFRAIFRSKLKEGHESKVDLSNEQPHILARVIAFLYAKEYYFTMPVSIGAFADFKPTDDERTTFLDVYLCADRLQVSELKDVLFSRAATHFPPGSQTLESCFIPLITKVLESTTSGDALRSWVVSNFIRASVFHKTKSSEDDGEFTLWERVKHEEPLAYQMALLNLEEMETMSTKLKDTHSKEIDAISSKLPDAHEKKVDDLNHAHQAEIDAMSKKLSNARRKERGGNAVHQKKIKALSKKLSDAEQAKQQNIETMTRSLENADITIKDIEEVVRGRAVCRYCGGPFRIIQASDGGYNVSCTHCWRTNNMTAWIQDVKGQSPIP